MVATNNTNMEFDWSGGQPLHSKQSLWVIYSLLNVIGSILCSFLIIGIKLLQPSSSIGIHGRKDVNTRTSADIFIASLCIGCILFSLPCVIQCVMNLSKGAFAYGIIACDIQAFFHIAAILLQFLSIMVGGLRNYLAVVRNYVISERSAIIICCCLGVDYFPPSLLSQPTYLRVY
jgi:hypothetical protein